MIIKLILYYFSINIIKKISKFILTKKLDYYLII